MRHKKPYLANMAKVQISRTGETAVIAYRAPGVMTTHLVVGPELDTMSDPKVLDIT